MNDMINVDPATLYKESEKLHALILEMRKKIDLIRDHEEDPDNMQVLDNMQVPENDVLFELTDNAQRFEILIEELEHMRLVLNNAMSRYENCREKAADIVAHV